MQIYQSIGTSTIVALMAAHRAACHRSDAAPAAFDQAAVASIKLYLAGDAQAPADQRRERPQPAIAETASHS